MQSLRWVWNHAWEYAFIQRSHTSTSKCFYFFLKFEIVELYFFGVVLVIVVALDSWLSRYLFFRIVLLFKFFIVFDCLIFHSFSFHFFSSHFSSFFSFFIFFCKKHLGSIWYERCWGCLNRLHHCRDLGIAYDFTFGKLWFAFVKKMNEWMLIDGLLLLTLIDWLRDLIWLSFLSVSFFSVLSLSSFPFLSLFLFCVILCVCLQKNQKGHFVEAYHVVHLHNEFLHPYIAPNLKEELKIRAGDKVYIFCDLIFYGTFLIGFF